MHLSLALITQLYHPESTIDINLSKKWVHVSIVNNSNYRQCQSPNAIYKIQNNHLTRICMVR